jgi:putative exporter of polyketide antibiotics
MASYGFIGLVFMLLGLIISILMIVAMLKIPKIARYHRATMLLTACIAKKHGLNEKIVKDIVNDAGETISFGSDL